LSVNGSAGLVLFGFRTALKILTIVGDGAAFPTAGHLAAYAGLAPVTRRSGSSIKGETRSQRGNHALKSALFLSAFASLADPTSRAYYDRKRAQGKRHNAALVCLARRRIDVIYAMLRDRKPYQQHAPATPEPSPAAAQQVHRDTPRRARLLVSAAAAAAVVLAVLTAVLVAGWGGGPAVAYGSTAFGEADLAVGFLVLARAGAVARTDAARGWALCIRCCLWALCAVLPVFIVGGVASYLTRRCAHMGGARWPASCSSPWSVWRPGSVSCCRSELPGELSCGLTRRRGRGAFTVAGSDSRTRQVDEIQSAPTIGGVTARGWPGVALRHPAAPV